MKRSHALFAALLIGASFGAGAHEGEGHTKARPVRMEQTEWGIGGDARAAKRTIELIMSDHMRFTPDRIEVKEGETVKFVVRNKGRMLHEFVIGTKKALDEHAALMLKFPNMEHDEAYMAHVKPGAAGEVVWTFNRPGSFEFGCLIPGHYQAGMVGRIDVAPAADAQAKGAKVPGLLAQQVSTGSGWKTVADAAATAPASDMADAEVRNAANDAGKLTVTEIQPVK